RERHVHTRRLEFGRQSISSSRGSSSAVHNPFVALRRASTTEAHGEAIGVALVYSANFLAEVEVEPFGSARLRIGIDPETFAWSLPPGAEFATPEAVVVHTRDGLGAMSDAFHRLFRERVARGAWRDRPRPILVNNWEGTYFDFDEDRLIAIATVARDLGIELFVLDDGRPEVVDHLERVLVDVLGSAPITYVKWDMNRWISEPWSAALPPDRQGEFFHRYILGVYELYRRLTTTFPDILFESCAGGGGRFDGGMLAYAPQAWTSDDTDA